MFKKPIQAKSMDETVSISVKILLISYLHRCTKSGLSKKWVPYRELEGVGHAYDAFALRGIKKLVQFFGNKGELLLKAADKLGAKPYPVGDIGLELQVLPNLPLVLILWLGDEEFEAAATILFDSSASKELHVEDLAGVGSLVVDELIEIANTL